MSKRAKPTECQLDHLAEKVRLVGSDDGAYQHLLDTLAADLEEEYRRNLGYLPFRVQKIADFVRKWRP